MKKILIVILLISSLFSSCKTIKKDSPIDNQSINEIEDLVSSVDLTSSNIFVGISNMMPSTQTMRKQSLLNALKQDLLNDYVVISTRDIYLSENNGYDFYKTMQVVGYSDKTIQEKFNKIEIIDELYNQRNGSVILIKDNSKEDKKIYNVEYDDSGKPKWLNTKIEIEGYYVGKGISDSEFTIPKKVESATYECFINIYKNSGFANDIVISDNFGNDNSFRDESFIAGTAKLKGFKIIDYYYDKISGEYHCLGVIKKG